jgi:SAM-dependent methyltransferase
LNGGWDESAEAWIRVIGEDGDWGRRHVLDAPLLAWASKGPAGRAIDIGCGEGRFCRMLRQKGFETLGVDPTAALIERARSLDVAGDYRVEGGEALSARDGDFDLAVFYLSLIDIGDYRAAIAEAWRVLKPGGRLLIANLQGFNTAAVPLGWTREPDGSRRFCIDRYLTEREVWTEWQGIRIVNHHRPFGLYVQALLAAGFRLVHFDEPAPDCEGEKADRYRRVPNFLVMGWVKN